MRLLTTQSRTDTQTLIPKNREMSTAARLNLVADIIEQHPEAHDQSVWAESVIRYRENVYEGSPLYVSEQRDCGTVACVAGWAVACSPPALVKSAKPYVWIREDGTREEASWSAAGAKALGIDQELADDLFAAGVQRDQLVKALRMLAMLPPEKRTAEEAEKLGVTIAWLTGRQHVN